MKKSLDELPLLLTMDDLAEVLPVCRNARYNLVKSGAIKSIRVGKRILIPKSALKELLEA